MSYALFVPGAMECPGWVEVELNQAPRPESEKDQAPISLSVQYRRTPSLRKQHPTIDERPLQQVIAGVALCDAAMHGARMEKSCRWVVLYVWNMPLQQADECKLGAPSSLVIFPGAPLASFACPIAEAEWQTSQTHG